MRNSYLILCSCGQTDMPETKYTSMGRKVEIVEHEGQFTLYRNGEPYYIKGAAGYEHYDRVQAYGGNSIRVWHADNAQQILDEAHALGLTVSLGLWVARERDGFNYYDKKEVIRQVESLREVVLKFKDHPALLMWGVGNELYAESSNVKVWDAVNLIAEMIHEVDPNHPTTTTVMNVPHKVIDLIVEKAPALDVLSINSFAAMHNLHEELYKSSWKGPYIVSEFGPRGYWEAFTTEWLAPIEQTSTEKAAYTLQRYKRAIEVDTIRCLGSYVFMWGNKQETTPTWFSMMSEQGEETESVHLVRKIWSGQEPVNAAPYIAPLMLDNKYAEDNIYLEPGQPYVAKVNTFDHDGDSLQLHWEVLPESEKKDGNSDKQVKPTPLPGLLNLAEAHKPTLTAPTKEGAYRLFVYVYDGKGNLATANVPFYVRK
ncbi:hypothetical protein FVR03_09945 [Pontibacter qinzhouensis]|uniref:Glycoside hydrolase family 2 catalytic domain-containing protein n=2 Tax=Pontibacter qinzhouensis TaxID=2603253 RepID=A0A5C8K660_9BACT|nr:hypothetical protein FVR03_09945 [Pontibacter qinzhouensis]